jgi:hypothetical protein
MNAWYAAVSVAAMCAAGCATNPRPIQIVALPPGDAPVRIEGTLDGYPGALAAITDAFEALGLPRSDVRLVLFPDRRSFEEGLQASGYPPDLARSASSFAAIGGARAVLLNAGVVDRLNRTARVQLVAHELVHSLQYQFGGGTRGASEQWLREGFAEWVSYRVTAHLGLASFASLREDLLTPLAQMRFGIPPAPLDKLVTFPQWVDAQRRYEVPLYTQAFMAADLLIQMRGVPAVVGYFERFRSTSEHERAFAAAFGLDRAAFESDFVRRWHETVAQVRASR